jgi:DNA polymerase I-like protein with 3'-5' exonuclease and polymerase domains/uracil-DNA glycosylase
MPLDDSQVKPAKPKKEKKPPKFNRDVTEHKAIHGLVPEKTSPFCLKCGLHNCGAKNPYIQFEGSTDPLITVVFDAVGRREDAAGKLACEGSQNGILIQRMERFSKELGFDMTRVRMISTSRCANYEPQKVNYATKGNWCRAFVVDDLRKHPPQLVMPVGTTALGLLCHKSNAYDWAGKVLNWRGYPDDWLVDSRYDAGHPALGLPTALDRRPMVPVLAPRLVFLTQNPIEIKRWERQVKLAMQLALSGITPNNYDRPWFRLLSFADEVIEALKAIPEGARVSYDLETTGLLPFGPRAAIVFAMFRYDLPDGTKVAFGFPWKYPESPLVNDIARITPHLLAALYRARLFGHNIAFDIVYTFANVDGANLERLTAAIEGDTRHMAYVIRQSNQSLGLELLAYDWAPDMAGYEEDFVLLKDKMPELLDPGSSPDAHYARCPAEKWETHLKPYVMGDVEVVHQAVPRLRTKMDAAKRYQIPIADPNHLGRFRRFETPSRTFVYDKLMLPASRVLTRIQGRGMFVDQTELSVQEDLFPKLIKEARSKLRDVDSRVLSWCEQQEAVVPDWALDLEDREQLKTILFNILHLPVKRLTKAGEALFGEDISKAPHDQLVEYAAIDKFTIMNMVAENQKLKPLQEYRKLYKAYTTYVRSMRNVTHAGVDKHARKKDPYLMRDSCVHPTFNQAGTRGGRLSSSSPNAQQIPRDSLVKKLYTSRFGPTGIIWQTDLSQIELRLLAAFCGDAAMVKAYRENIDLHSLTTSRVFDVPYEHFEKSYMAWLQENGRSAEAKELDRKRKIAKQTNFLTSYGGGAFGLQNSLAEQGVYLTLEECERIVEAFFDTYPDLRRHVSLYKKFIMEHGCAVSVTGRVRAFEDVHSDDGARVSKALRSGFNQLIQPTASDMMLCCMGVIDGLMEQAGLESILMSTVHDSLVVDAKREELPKVYDICNTVMNNIPEVMEIVLGPEFDSSWMYVVPFAADSECGKSYYQSVKISPDKHTGQVDWGRVLATVDAAA